MISNFETSQEPNSLCDSNIVILVRISLKQNHIFLIFGGISLRWKANEFLPRYIFLNSNLAFLCKKSYHFYPSINKRFLHLFMIMWFTINQSGITFYEM